MGSERLIESSRVSIGSEEGSLRLRIGPIVERAEAIADQVSRELPAHQGLAAAARGVARVAREARHVSQRLQRLLGFHRLPALFLLVALISLVVVIYRQFIHVSKISIAVSSRDAVGLRAHLNGRVQFKIVETPGSSASFDLLQCGKADVAFIQGGIPFAASGEPTPWLVRRIAGSELILFFLRERRSRSSIQRILTSTRDQGSHTLCQTFLACWGLNGHVTFTHDWRQLTEDEGAEIPGDIDAIFVVKDPLNPSLTGIPDRLRRTGFHLASPDIGAYALRLDYLKDAQIRPGFLDPAKMLPDKAVLTYSVATYLLANPHLRPRELAAVGQLAKQATDDYDFGGFDPTVSETSEILQGLEAAMGILVYIGLAFLALLGLDAYFYQRRFNELNSLVSLISMHQSTKDALHGSREHQARDVAYLRICSDLLGLISVITGYYAQENASLLYNRLLDVVNERAASLKINIQLKILHSSLDLPSLKELGQYPE